ncbi:hypothetical protein [Paenibacillus graminis]|uniref:hypothetical protein n=1 Tax=Paenibacillus graminis TaxID=189425 RepID=UPI0012DC6DA5|nr:hypothetical protein [Paenibacillus graminis]
MQFADAPESLRSALLFVHEQLTQHNTALAMPGEAGNLPQIIAELVRQAVKLRCFGLAAELAGLFPEHRTDWAEALYESGPLKEAGELLITLAADQQAGERFPFIWRRCCLIKATMAKLLNGSSICLPVRQGMNPPASGCR